MIMMDHCINQTLIAFHVSESIRYFSTCAILSVFLKGVTWGPICFWLVPCPSNRPSVQKNSCVVEALLVLKRKCKIKVDKTYVQHFSDLLVGIHFKCHQMHLYLQRHHLERILLAQKKAIVCHLCFGTLCWVTTCNDTVCFTGFVMLVSFCI